MLEESDSDSDDNYSVFELETGPNMMEQLSKSLKPPTSKSRFEYQAKIDDVIEIRRGESDANLTPPPLIVNRRYKIVDSGTPGSIHPIYDKALLLLLPTGGERSAKSIRNKRRKTRSSPEQKRKKTGGKKRTLKRQRKSKN